LVFFCLLKLNFLSKRVAKVLIKNELQNVFAVFQQFYQQIIDCQLFFFFSLQERHIEQAACREDEQHDPPPVKRRHVVGREAYDTFVV
jgi:hypothetical protein